MNQTATTVGNVSSVSIDMDTTSVLTTVQLAVIVVLALLVVAGIVYGMRVKRRRLDADRRVVEHAEEAGVPVEPLATLERNADAAPPPAAPAPAAAPASPPSAPASDDVADRPVTDLKGLGPKVAARLGELGITTVGQIAALDDDAAQRLDAELGPFRGRLERDRWIEQARFLAAGDVKGFEAVFGKL